MINYNLFSLLQDSLFYSRRDPFHVIGSDSPTDYSDDESYFNDGLHPTENSIKYALSLKEDEFTEARTINIYCATWNVNGRSPLGFVRPWLSHSTLETPPDIYAIGFQELDLSREAFLFTESEKEDEWKAVVDVSLHPKAKYVRYC